MVGVLAGEITPGELEAPVAVSTTTALLCLGLFHVPVSFSAYLMPVQRLLTVRFFR